MVFQLLEARAASVAEHEVVGRHDVAAGVFLGVGAGVSGQEQGRDDLDGAEIAFVEGDVRHQFVGASGLRGLTEVEHVRGAVHREAREVGDGLLETRASNQDQAILRTSLLVDRLQDVLQVGLGERGGRSVAERRGRRALRCRDGQISLRTGCNPGAEAAGFVGHAAGTFNGVVVGADGCLNIPF